MPTKIVSLIAFYIMTLCPTLAFSSEQDSLYQRIGGFDIIEKVSIRTLEYSHSDPRISDKFENSSIPRNSKLLAEYLCELADGPCKYEGQEMHKVHHGLGLNNAHFNAMGENMQKAMRDYNIPFVIQSKLMSRIVPKHHDVVVRSRTGR